VEPFFFSGIKILKKTEESSSNVTMATFPNPDTYLNHIPPAQAAEFEAARNLALAVLGVCTASLVTFINL
jgi:hypothetical protein